MSSNWHARSRSAPPDHATREVVASFAQRRVWLAEQIDPGTPVYNIVSALRLRGPLDVSALRHAVTTIHNRHEALRTSFRLRGDDLVQCVRPRRAVPVPVTDLSDVPVHERQQAVERALAAARDTPLDLAREDLLRTSILRLDPGEHLLVTTVHHIVFDAWSWGVYCRELQACYHAHIHGTPPGLPPLQLQYADFSVRQREEMNRARLARQLEYWRRQLRDLPNTELVGSVARPAEPHWEGRRLSLQLAPDLVQRVNQMSRSHRVTPSMTYLSAFHQLLHRYTGANDLAVASPVAGRTSADVENLIGLFINTLVLRADLSGNPRFQEVLEQIRDTTLDAYANQEVSFEHVVDELDPPRALANPFTQVLFSMQNAPAAPLELDGLRVERVDLDTSATKMDLRLNVGVEQDGGWLAWGYRTELFERDDVERISRHYVAILEAVAADPTARVDDLPLVPFPEQEEVLARGRGQPLSRHSAETLHERYQRHVRQTPDATAVSAADAILSYWQLDRAAAALAGRLQDAGTVRGDLVAIAIDRSAAMAVAVLATIKVGGAYVPVDPDLPARRVASLITDAAPRVLLVADRRLGIGPGQVTVCPVDVAELLDERARDTPPVRATGADIAYVLYTSGSTGEPKGVAVTHSNVLSYLAGIDGIAGLHPGRYAMVQPLSVDSSVTMMHGAWYGGGTLYPVDRRIALDAAAMAHLIRQERIDYLKIAPSHLETLQQAGQQAAELMPARWLMIGGEASSHTWAQQLAAMRPGCAVYNHYGPTEATVGVLVHLVRPSGDGIGFTPLGRPVPGTDVYVLDAAGRLAPPLVAGELCVAGAQVACGYINRPAQTAAQFVADPFCRDPGRRMYRTGDRARLLADGTVEFLERDDDQVKIRGYRVELGAVAAVLRSHPGVREALVRAPDVAGASTLIGYVTAGADSGPNRPSQDALLAFLRQRLPQYMVPSTVVVLDTLPLTRHGKLDVGALPTTVADATARDGAEQPHSPAERRIANIWSRMLGVQTVSRHDDFFRLGGHSLLATRIAGELARAFGVDVPVARLFTHPTPASLAAYLAHTPHLVTAATSSSPLVPFTSDGTETVVCIHPISGTAGCYAALARHLSGYSVVGVESEALRTGTAPPTSVPVLAERYLAAAWDADGQEPLRLLAGWSMGGLVAYEMAQRLAASGWRVDEIILIDTVVPHHRTSPPSDAELTSLLVRDMAASLGATFGQRTMVELADLDHVARLQRVRRWLSGSGAVPGGMSMHELKRRFAIFRANYLAQFSYRPPTSVVPVTLVRPVVHSERSQQWHDLVPEHMLTVREFEGDHYSLLTEPTVAQVAGWLRSHLGTPGWAGPA